MQHVERKHAFTSFFSVMVLLFLMALGLTVQEARAEVNVDVQVPVAVEAPPPMEMAAPPDVVVVPSEQYPNQYAYMVPGMEGVYVHEGVWYRSYNGVWYSASAYNAVWAPVEVAIVPPVILSVPIEYALFLPPLYYRIHYADYHEHWRSWDHNRHWNNYGWYKHEMRADVRRDRMHHVEDRRAERGKEHMGHERHIASHQSLGREKAEEKKPHIATHQSLGKEKVGENKAGNKVSKQDTQARRQSQPGQQAGRQQKVGQKQPQPGQQAGRQQKVRQKQPQPKKQAKKQDEKKDKK